MKIISSANINEIYVQALCMTFFHGIKFPKNEENSDGLMLCIDCEEIENEITSCAELTFKDKCIKSTSLCKIPDFESRERAFKVSIGQAVFSVCSQMTGITPEWGILTGIRPSKVASDILRTHSIEETKKILVEKYLLSDLKADLVIQVAKNECEIMSLTNDKKCSVYISIPFCPTRCAYCSFISYAGKKLFELIPSYIEKLVIDIEKTFLTIKKLGLDVSCIYVGGGTPTMLNNEQFERVLSTIYKCIDGQLIDEFTLEGGRPDTFTKEKLKIAKKYGVDRISVNPQTLNNEVLVKIGRNHTVDDFFKAYDIAVDSEIENINTDLIAGLDNDTFESFSNTVDKIVKLNPSNITVHTFSVKKSAQILRDDSSIYQKDGEVAEKSVNYAFKTLVKNGYIPYYMYRQKNTVNNLENVGYARSDAFGLYNVFMMSDAHTVFGIGAGATTKFVKNNSGKTEILRIFSPKYPYEYLRENQNIFEKAEKFFERR